MCTDPKMRATLLAELRDELAARKTARGAGHGARRWHAVVIGAAACVALIAIW